MHGLINSGWRPLRHGCPSLPQQLSCFPHDTGNGVGNGEGAVVHVVRHPQFSRIDTTVIAQGQRWLDIDTIDDLQTQRHIGDGASQHAYLTDDGLLADRHAVATRVGRTAGRRLDTGNAAERGRDAHADTDVSRQAQRRSARRNDRPLASTAAARGAVEIPRIVRSPIERIVALIVEQALRDIGLPEDDGPCRAQACDERIISFSEDLRS